MYSSNQFKALTHVGLSRAWHWVHVSDTTADWLIVLFVFALIGQLRWL